MSGYYTGGIMDSVRCKNCNKLLFKGGFKHIEIKCPRCKRYIVISNAKEHPQLDKLWFGEMLITNLQR